MGEDIFSLDNILDDTQLDSIGLFQDEEPVEKQEEREIPGDTPEEKNNKSETTEVNPEDLFTGEPESVGSGENQDNQEEQSSEDSGDSSPKSSVYSSIAKACYDDDVFPDLDEADIDEVVDADSFKELFEKQLKAKLDEAQKRILSALENNVQPSQIQQYENTLGYLNNITEEALSEESEEAEELRKRIIFQDYLNKGFSRERAQREVKKALDNGTDIEDAKDALDSNKEFFSSQYKSLLKDAEREAQKVKEQQTKEAEALKQSIEKDDYLGDITLDNKTRRRIFDTISKPKYKDKETGKEYTELQQFEREHKADFLKYVGTIYTITDGFKNFDKFVKGKVSKEVNKNIRELESKLANTSRNSDGTLTFMGGKTKSQDLSPFASGWKLNV